MDNAPISEEVQDRMDALVAEPSTADTTRRYGRYVAIGDSTTEGLDDPDGMGGYRGWANRFAEAIAVKQGHLLYANLAVRGLKTREILDQQLQPALKLRPDLATVVCGTNDVLRPKFSLEEYRRDVCQMQQALTTQGATVLTFTLPDLAAVNPTARLVRERVMAMNQVLRDLSTQTGAIVVDLAQHSITSDRRLWSRDRLHANAKGHERIAAALAQALALDGSDAAWSVPLPHDAADNFAQRWAEHVYWGRHFLVPWLMRRVRGRSSADGVTCKRPALLPVDVRSAEGVVP